MIEVHLVRPKRAAAVRAWHFSNSPQKCERVCLALPNSSYFAIPVEGVVPPVCLALIPAGRHGASIELMFETRVGGDDAQHLPTILGDDCRA